MRSDHQFVYGQAISRISDLNKVLFSYRLFLVSIIAAYYTALNFVAQISNSIGAMSTLDTSLLLVFALSIAAIVGITIVAFFDYTYQELVEHCIEAIVRIERDSGQQETISIFDRPGRGLVSIWINSASVLLYSAPALALAYLVYHLFIAMMSADPASAISANIALQVCDSLTMEGGSMPTFGLGLGSVDCLSNPPSFRFFGRIELFIVVGFLVAILFMGLFTIFSLHRIVARLLLHFFAKKWYFDKYMSRLGGIFAAAIIVLILDAFFIKKLMPIWVRLLIG
jgi:hypothetical protein